MAPVYPLSCILANALATAENARNSVYYLDILELDKKVIG